MEDEAGSNECNRDTNLRVDIPQKNMEKFRQIFLHVLKKIGSRPNVGKTVLLKLFYFIDFDYCELYEEQLIGLAYIKNHYGPTPIHFDAAVVEMKNNGQIVEVQNKYFKNDQVKYSPIVEPDLNALSAKETKHSDGVLDRLSEMDASALSALSHRDIPWIGTKNGALIPYESVFYRNHETSVRVYENCDL